MLKIEIIQPEIHLPYKIVRYRKENIYPILGDLISQEIWCTPDGTPLIQVIYEHFTANFEMQDGERFEALHPLERLSETYISFLDFSIIGYEKFEQNEQGLIINSKAFSRQNNELKPLNHSNYIYNIDFTQARREWFNLENEYCGFQNLKRRGNNPIYGIDDNFYDKNGKPIPDLIYYPDNLDFFGVTCLYQLLDEETEKLHQSKKTS